MQKHMIFVVVIALHFNCVVLQLPPFLQNYQLWKPQNKDETASKNPETTNKTAIVDLYTININEVVKMICETTSPLEEYDNDARTLKKEMDKLHYGISSMGDAMLARVNNYEKSACPQEQETALNELVPRFDVAKYYVLDLDQNLGDVRERSYCLRGEKSYEKQKCRDILENGIEKRSPTIQLYFKEEIKDEVDKATASC